jgi:protein-S-isoprenylcysteine O-methyltransferase Ste14
MLVYGAASYGVGVAALVDLILIMLGVLDFTGGPVHLESPLLAGAFNLGLLVAFALQHSVMARARFKERWTRIIHPSLERSSYLLATGAVLLPLLWLWQPMPTVLWSLGSPLARRAVTGVALLGWVYLFAASFAINHFELFGLQQAWRGFRGEGPAAVPFRERWMYRIDRHPIMTGILVGLWATPEMTQGHLLFAASFSLYVAVGVHFEERALRRQWGETYEDYRRRAPTIVPLPWWRRPSSVTPSLVGRSVAE